MATSSNPKIDVFNIATNEATKIVMTAEELAERQTQKLEADAQLVAETAKAAARQSALAKLKELGLTEAEIAAL